MSKELYHWGIKGMHWGVRRYQNKDGSLTPAGRKRYSEDDNNNRSSDSTNESSSSARRSVSDMSDAELRERINRLNMEKQYKDLTTPNEDLELQRTVQRLNMEKQYKELTAKNTKKGAAFIANAVKVGTAVATLTTVGINVYNNAAKTHNAFKPTETEWPIIGQDKKKDKKD